MILFYLLIQSYKLLKSTRMFIEIQIKLLIVIIMGLASLRLFFKKRNQQENVAQNDFTDTNSNQNESNIKPKDKSRNQEQQIRFQDEKLKQEEEKLGKQFEQQTLKRIKQTLMINIIENTKDEQGAKKNKFLQSYFSKNVYLQSIVGKSESSNKSLLIKYLPLQQTPSYPQAITNQQYFSQSSSILNTPVNFYNTMDVEQECGKNQTETKLFRFPLIELKTKQLKKRKIIVKNVKTKNKHQKWRKQWIKKVIERFSREIKAQRSVKMRWESHQQLWSFINSQWECYRQQNMFRNLRNFFQGLNFNNENDFKNWFSGNKIQKIFLEYFKRQFDRFFQQKNDRKMMMSQLNFIEQFEKCLYRQYVRVKIVERNSLK